jgi:hypothetical protein
VDALHRRGPGRLLPYEDAHIARGWWLRGHLLPEDQRRGFYDLTSRPPGWPYSYAYSPLGVDLHSILTREFDTPGLVKRMDGG